MSAAGPAVAAIDLGTNTALLLVARTKGDGDLEVLAQACEAVRLGQADPRGNAGFPGSPVCLYPPAVERTLDVLGAFKQEALSLGVHPGQIRVVATAVLRRVSDADVFVRHCAAELGLAVDILSGEEEARLGRVGLGGLCSSVTIDVGGGSTEVSFPDGRVGISAPLGALLLTQSYLGLGGLPPAHPGGVQALEGELRRAFEVFPSDSTVADAWLLGGTAANLACLELGLPDFDPARADGVTLPSARVRKHAQHLLSMEVDQRKELPIEANRAEILPAGLLCIAACLERMGVVEARVSGRGLRHGVALDLLRGVSNGDSNSPCSGGPVD